jgi:hypothetical protein
MASVTAAPVMRKDVAFTSFRYVRSEGADEERER